MADYLNSFFQSLDISDFDAILIFYGPIPFRLIKIPDDRPEFWCPESPALGICRSAELY
ncbi:hypothetical protein TREMEDRAFT_57627 [Tremella mesenterica DSM 1558]|uniref:uncharacterized protein n=1 Tax=Tremella mesenterica (strain ATCC 24925 / CBS 8224 / DSM 1558 / NBRC 9311 / NRRL Y-6157 / RJB 2259-6 / UBC 559-6) TaxID=578456 RepID=UPI0003F4A61F|nr:uncharacterized protein TREMEDRAFT_57627 [Tremella mesenterica DSM 1558]EIW66944.1 hypothetical protein TREMEDRAFT_57627 [Tremella mesenterica DSM 1558]